MSKKNTYAIIGNLIPTSNTVVNDIGNVVRGLIYGGVVNYYIGCNTKFDEMALYTLSSLKNYFEEIEIYLVNNNFEENFFKGKELIYNRFNYIDFCDRKQLKFLTYKKMIDNSIGIIACVNFEDKSAESKAIEYAKEQNKKIINLNNI